MGANVQFTNKDDVLDAYKRMKIAPWSIKCGKAVNFSCQAKSENECLVELTEYLEMLDRQDTAVYYTLCVYDADDISGHITDKTPAVASFNFRLTESASGIGRVGNESLSGMTVGSLRKQWDSERALMDEIKALRMEVQEMKEGGDDEPDDFGLGKVGLIMNHPQIGPMAQQLVSGVLGFLNSLRPGAAAPAAPQPGNRIISGVPGADPAADAMNILNAAYPDFPVLLSKLARMHQVQPAQLKMYIEMLRTLSV